MRRLNRLSAYRKWLAGCEDYTVNKQEGHLDCMCCCACAKCQYLYSVLFCSAQSVHMPICGLAENTLSKTLANVGRYGTSRKKRKPYLWSWGNFHFMWSSVAYCLS